MQMGAKKCKDGACGRRPIEAENGSQTAECLFTGINKLPLHLFVCVRVIHCHAPVCLCGQSQLELHPELNLYIFYKDPEP